MFARLVTAFATLLVPAGVAAQANPAPLLGTLLDPEGKPLAGVMIEAWRAEGKGMVCLDLVYSRKYRRVARAPTDKRGRFALQLPIGLPCQLRVDHPPFAKVVRDGTLPGEKVILRLEQGVTFSGVVSRVEDGTGEPSAVRAWNTKTGEEVLRGRTDAQGRFRFDRIAPGLIRIDVDPDKAMSPSWRDVEFVAGDHVQLKFAVKRGVVLRGRVVDAESGKPIAGARVGEGWTFNRGVITNADGRYELFGFGAKGYDTVHCLARGHVKQVVDSKPLKQQNKDVTLDFRLVRGEEAVGRVVGPTGKPVQGVYVAAIANACSDAHDWIPTRTDAEGRFHIPGLRPDVTHVIMLRCAGWASVVYYLPKGDGVVHRLGDVEMRRPRVVRGRVVGLKGRPVDRIKVGLWGANADRMRFLEAAVDEEPRGRDGSPWTRVRYYVAYRYVRTDTNGEFAFGDVPPGTYKLVVYGDRSRIIGSRPDVRVTQESDPKPVELSADVEQEARAATPSSPPPKRK